jgi:DNA-binding GntR family transcriptional regulator
MRKIRRPKSLAQQAHRAIKEAIRDQVILPGTFYSEQAMADVLDISRTPVREAVLDLARAGLLEVVPRRGFRLREISADEQDEIFELRALLEGHIVRKLSQRISDANLRSLQAILDRQARLGSNPARFLDVDEEFHLKLVELAGFRKALDFLVELRGTIWLLGLTALARPARASMVLDEHRAIVAALERHDDEGAARAMTDHIESTRMAIEAALGARPDAA